MQSCIDQRAFIWIPTAKSLSLYVSTKSSHLFIKIVHIKSAHVTISIETHEASWLLTQFFWSRVLFDEMLLGLDRLAQLKFLRVILRKLQTFIFELRRFEGREQFRFYFCQMLLNSPETSSLWKKMTRRSRKMEKLARRNLKATREFLKDKGSNEDSLLKVKRSVRRESSTETSISYPL